MRYRQIFLLLLLTFSTAYSQSISVSGPSGITVSDADEFFTDVWGNPKNFDSFCDMGFDSFAFSPKQIINNDWWEGVNPSFTAPVLDAMNIPTPGALIPYIENCGKLGINYPLDSSKYNEISFKYSTSDPSSYTIYWSNDSGFATSFASYYDGIFLPEVGVLNTANEWIIHSHDLSAQDQSPWSGAITGLSLWPSYSAPTGSTTRIDWLRVIDSSTSSSFNYSWNTSGSSGMFGDQVVLYVDDNNQGYDGIPVKRNLPLNGTDEFLTGVLEPGTYYFYLEWHSNSKTEIFVTAQSSYFGPITINAKPVLKFTSPSRTSGQEYSLAERNDPWDMSELSDVANIIPDPNYPVWLAKGYHGERIDSGVFFAISDQAPVDTHLALPVPVPIDPKDYRYFCHSMWVSNQYIPRDGDAVKLNEAGWVARVAYSDVGIGTKVGSTKAHELKETTLEFVNGEYKGFTTYCIDLWDDRSNESGTSWLDMEKVTHIRFDPVESTPPTDFAIDKLGLYAENTLSELGQFNITWEVFDQENDSLNISLYFDTDNSGFDGTFIETIFGTTTSSYTWDASAVNLNKVYIYAVVSDGLNETMFYSDVPIILEKSIVSNFTPPCDYNGDSKSDLAFVRQDISGLSAWFRKITGSGEVAASSWGINGRDIYIPTDFNHDGISELNAVTALSEPYLTWFGLEGITRGIDIRNWGVEGDVPISFDNYKYPAIYRPSEGTWWSTGSISGNPILGDQWGIPGDIPQPADFDGDGKTDLAIWRPSTGSWWVSKSSENFNRTEIEKLFFAQWGLGEDHPMVGDYTGDRRADFVVWRPSSGHWFICHSEQNYNCFAPGGSTMIQWGLPGDTPIYADFDADEILDLTVYRPSNGYWFSILSSTGEVKIEQFGGEAIGDFPVCIGMRDRMNQIR